jgi:type II secretory pathway predicted ATPase ExeA
VVPRPARPADRVAPAHAEGPRERPFSASCDPMFLYHAASHDAAAQAMLSAIRRRDGIVVVTGPAGIGKTIVCRAVLEQLDWRTFGALVSASFATPEDLVKAMLVGFGVISPAELRLGHVRHAGSLVLGSVLREFVSTLAPLDGFAVVIVDSAENLSAPALELLGGLCDTRPGGRRLMQIVLAGRPALSKLLRGPAGSAASRHVVARATIGPLDRAELAGYVAHGLDLSGAHPHVTFDAAAIDRLGTLSAGVPRTVNVIANRAVDLALAAASSTVDAPTLDRAAADRGIGPPDFGRRLGIAPVTRRLRRLFC